MALNKAEEFGKSFPGPITMAIIFKDEESLVK